MSGLDSFVDLMGEVASFGAIAADSFVGWWEGERGDSEKVSPVRTLPGLGRVQKCKKW